VSGGGHAQAQTEKRYNAIQLQRSAYGGPVPLVFGKNRLAGTLIWYGSFTATPHTQSAGGKGGGGGSGNTSYTYSAAVALGLCEGPITGIGQVWVDKSLQTVANLGFTLFTGAGGQAAWSYLTTNFPAQADPFDHTAYVANASVGLGSSAGLANYSWEIQGFFTDVTLGGDAEPYNVVNGYCTDANYGCGFNYLASLTGANSFQQYCKALGLTISPIETSQRPAKDFLADILKITNSEWVWSAAGVAKIIPRADVAVSGNGASFTPGNGAGGAITTPIYTISDSGFVAAPDEDPVVLVAKPSSDLFNVIRAEFLDRSNSYNTAPAEAKDDADIAANGERVAQTLKLDAVTQLSVARQVAEFEKNKALYYPNQFEFKATPDYCLPEPMDILALVDPTLGLVNTLVRILKMEEGDDSTDEIKFTVEELPIGPGTAPQYGAQASGGFVPNYAQAPGSVQTPKVLAAPPMLVGSNGGYEFWIAVSGPSASVLWGGCNVWMSLDGGTIYAQVGVITSPARYGTLSANFASGSDPDTTNTLSITLNNTALQLSGGSAGDADNMRLLALVDTEIVSFEYCTLTAPGAYTFTSTGLSGGTKYMRRGQYGSTIGAHSSGSAFVRLDGNVFKMPLDAGLFGATVNFKFQSFNIWGGGLESLAGLPAYTYTIPTVVGGIDTPQLLLNSATTVQSTTGTGTAGSNLGSTTVASLTVGPFPYACTVVVTASGWCTFTTGVNADSPFIWGGTGTLAGLNTFRIFDQNSQAANLRQSVAFSNEAVFALPANTTQTYYFSTIGVYNFGTTSYTINNWIFKTEAIKR